MFQRGLWLPQTWTLMYEMQFYIICGLLLAFPGRYFFKGTAVVTGLVLLAALLHYTVDKFNVGGIFLDGHWLLFAAGVAVYYQLTYLSPRQSWYLTASWILVLAASLFWRLHPGDTPWGPKRPAFFADELLGTAAFALVALFTHRWDTIISNIGVLRWFAYLGRASYSIYLVHWHCIVAVMWLMGLTGLQGPRWTVGATLPASFCLSLVAGWGFYTYIERHFFTPPFGLTSWRQIQGYEPPIFSLDSDTTKELGRGRPTLFREHAHPPFEPPHHVENAPASQAARKSEG